jgi:hypothetical protein
MIVTCALYSCENTVSEQHALEEEVSNVVSRTKGEVESYRKQVNNIDQTNKKLEEVVKELRVLEENLEKNKDQDIEKRLSSITASWSQDSIINHLSRINNTLELRILAIYMAYGVNVELKRQYYLGEEGVLTGVGASKYDDFYFDDQAVLQPANYYYATLSFNKILERSFNSIFNIRRLLSDVRKSYSTNSISEIVSRLRSEGFRNDLSQLINYLESNRKDLINRIKDANTELANREKYLAELQEGLRSIERQRIDKILLIYVLPGFGIILLLMIYLPKFYTELEIKKIIFEKGLLLQLITVFLLTISILILGIGDKINSEVLGTLLGGISVYVLQTARNLSRDPE